MISLKTNKEKYFLNEKISKKLFKNESIGKSLASRVISEVIGADYEEVYNNITLSTDEIAFNSLTIDSVADAIYYNDKIYFDIEINSYNSLRKKRQLESYVFQLHLGQLKNHKDYLKIKKVFQINLDNYDLLGKNDFIYEISLMDKKYHEVVSDIMQIMHINLDYLRKVDYTEIEKSSLMKNLYVFVCGDKELDSIVKNGDEFMKEIVREVKEISGQDEMNFYLTDEEILELDRQDMINEMRQEVTEEVREEVKEEVREAVKNEVREAGRNEIIIQLYKNGASLDLISKSTNLSTREIQKIIENI